LVTRFPACIWNYIFTWKWKTCKQSTKAKNKKITYWNIRAKISFFTLEFHLAIVAQTTFLGITYQLLAVQRQPKHLWIRDFNVHFIKRRRYTYNCAFKIIEKYERLHCDFV